MTQHGLAGELEAIECYDARRLGGCRARRVLRRVDVDQVARAGAFGRSDSEQLDGGVPFDARANVICNFLHRSFHRTPPYEFWLARLLADSSSSWLTQKFVHFRLALRSRLPTRVHPNPLLRMLSNDLLDYLGKFLRVLEDIALSIARSNQFDGWFEA